MKEQKQQFKFTKYFLSFILTIYSGTHNWRFPLFGLFIEIFKDISLLDCLGLQYPCCNRSFNPSIRIPKSVSLYYSVADFNLLFLVIWIVAGSSAAPRHLVVEGHFLAPAWQNALGITGLAMSMVLNALVMGLMVFRISKVFQRLKPTSDEQILGATGGSTLRL